MNKLELVKDQKSYLKRLTDISKDIETLEAQIAFEESKTTSKGQWVVKGGSAFYVSVLRANIQALEHEKKDIIALYKEFNCE